MTHPFDDILNDPSFLPYYGWHDQHPPHCPYLPASQQHRSEFIEFAQVLADHGINGKCLQLGLGQAGGTHALFQSIFNQVITIDRDEAVVSRFKNSWHDPRFILIGGTQDESIQQNVTSLGPFDLLFIDADHRYAGARADWDTYAPLVHPGGIVAFHDAVQVVPGIEVRAVVTALEEEGCGFNYIGTHLGIAWMAR